MPFPKQLFDFSSALSLELCITVIDSRHFSRMRSAKNSRAEDAATAASVSAATWEAWRGRRRECPTWLPALFRQQHQVFACHSDGESSKSGCPEPSLSAVMRAECTAALSVSWHFRHRFQLPTKKQRSPRISRASMSFRRTCRASSCWRVKEATSDLRCPSFNSVNAAVCSSARAE